VKWKRGSTAGEYKSGDLTIRGAKTDWELVRGGKVIKSLSSKRSCQEYAEGLDEDDSGMDVEVDVEVPQQRSRNTHFATNGSLESVLASLRLDVSRLTDMVGLLATSISTLTAKIDSLKSRKA